MNSMDSIIITQPGDPDVLQLQQRPVPTPRPDEILIQVKAAGINRPDVIQRKGNYPAPSGAPADIPGLEVAGIVVKVGGEVTSFLPGDRVCALLAGGGYSTFVAVSSGQCLPIPANLSFQEAAALPETFFTVWSNIFDRADFQPGEHVLIHGGTSGIGVAAIQMITAMGGIVYATAGTEKKCRVTESLGASRGINYKSEDFEKVIREAGGVDIILDMVGGDYTQKNLNCLKEDGRLVIINAMRERMAQIDLMRLMVKRLHITGSTLRARDSSFKQKIGENLHKHIWPLIETDQIKPVIYTTFPLQEAAAAHRLMESGEHIGKIILTID